MKHKTIISLTVLLITLFFTASIVTAQDIKTRMKNRLPAINALKAKGVIGENNKGYLEFRGAKEKADVVNAENADRKTVYEGIAKREGAKPGLVGKRRAMQIRNIAKPGEWLQDDGGKWFKK